MNSNPFDPRIVVWKDVPDYSGYRIAKDGTIVVRSTWENLPLESYDGDDTVYLYKSGRDTKADKLSVKVLLKLAFPEIKDETIINGDISQSSVSEEARRLVARNGNQILRGVGVVSDRNSGTFTMFLPDGAPQILLNTLAWDIQVEDEFDLLWKCASENFDTQSKMIKINNIPMTREALLQIKRTEGRHYPGPLRDKTIYELIDYLLKELEGKI